MSERLVFEMYRRKRPSRLKESLLGAVMSAIPMWTLIKVSVSIGGMVGGPFAKYFKWIGMGIGVLFGLGTVYKTLDNYFSILSTVKGLFSLASVLKRLLTRSPKQINAEVEVEKMEKEFNELENEEEKGKKSKKGGEEEFSVIFLSESERVGLVSRTIGQAASGMFGAVKPLISSPLSNVGKFLANGFKLVWQGSQRNIQLLEVFGFIKRIVSFVLRNFILFFVLLIITVIVAFLIIHARKSKAGEKALEKADEIAAKAMTGNISLTNPPSDTTIGNIVKNIADKDKQSDIKEAGIVARFLGGLLGNTKKLISGDAGVLTKFKNGMEKIKSFTGNICSKFSKSKTQSSLIFYY